MKPIIEAAAGDDGARVGGGPIMFKRIETIGLDRATRRLPLKTLSHDALAPFTAPRAPLAGVPMDAPALMGVLNVTPDSFSDGGADAGPAAAVERGLALIAAGADFLDIGGESTRPGSDPVPVAEEQARVLPVIEGLVAKGAGAAISIDTRNAATARAALAAGAAMVNDVSAATHDPEMLAVVAETGAALCLMHAQGDPKTMQDAPRYRNVLIEVYDHLEKRIVAALQAGVARERLAVDPGLGFGKTLAHNITLLSGAAAFQGLGLPVMIGASRKGFIGKLSGEETPADRAPGSIAAALIAAQQGAQILRVHDVAETRQALSVWMAASGLWEP